MPGQASGGSIRRDSGPRRATPTLKGTDWQTPSTALRTSPFSKGSRRSGVVPACTSARPGRAASTTWSGRCSTTASTRRSPAAATRSPSPCTATGRSPSIDNGAGIPVGIVEGTGLPAVEVVMTKLHAGGKFGGDGYKVSGGLHGVGISVVNALSERLLVRVTRDGGVFEQRFARGAAASTRCSASPTRRARAAPPSASCPTSRSSRRASSTTTRSRTGSARWRS